jgi:hypothetical protein
VGRGLRAADGTNPAYQQAGLPVQHFRIPDNVLRLTPPPLLRAGACAVLEGWMSNPAAVAVLCRRSRSLISIATAG